jgi:ABC-2 type transport system permease protein
VSAILAPLVAQLQMTRRNVEDLMPVLTMPLFAVVFMAIFIHAGRRDLTGYALIAPLLMTVGQMGFFVASEIIADDRQNETLELIVATPTSFVLTLWPRLLALTALGLVGFAESWFVARVLFGTSVTFHHPWVVVATLFATVFAAAGTALITAALFCLGRTVRTFQNSITYPLYLLAGVLVPVSFLPIWVQPFSRLVFLYWSANLMRDAMKPEAVEQLVPRLAAVIALGLVGFMLGTWLVRRMLNKLRSEGTLGLA